MFIEAHFCCDLQGCNKTVQEKGFPSGHWVRVTIGLRNPDYKNQSTCDGYQIYDFCSGEHASLWLHNHNLNKE